MRTHLLMWLSAAVFGLGFAWAGCGGEHDDKASTQSPTTMLSDGGQGEDGGGKAGTPGTSDRASGESGAGNGKAGHSGGSGRGGSGGAPTPRAPVELGTGDTEKRGHVTLKNPPDADSVKVEIEEPDAGAIKVRDAPADTEPAGAVGLIFESKPKKPVVVTLVLSGDDKQGSAVIVIQVNDDGSYKIVSDSRVDKQAKEVTFSASDSGTYLALRMHLQPPGVMSKCTQDFEGGTIDGFEIAPVAKHSGMLGARPPALTAGSSAEYTLYCDNADQTQLEFSYYGGPVELFVDDKKYEDVPRSGWTTAKFVVVPGKHTYRWKASTGSAARPDFLLDDIIVSAHAVSPKLEGPWGFDEGYPPAEFAGFGPKPAGSWQITTESQNLGGFGARPPILAAGESAELELTCGAARNDNTGLVFAYYGGPIELFVDGEKYEDVPRSGWQYNKLVVAAGKHMYKWKVSSETAGRPDFMLDTVSCAAVPAQPNTTGTWSLDEGFVPPEFKGFGGPAAHSWQITTEAHNVGEFGARPPILTAGASAELELTCGAAKNDNTGIEFAYYGGPIELFVDDNKYEDVPRSGWVYDKLVVSAGKHTYKWKVSSGTADRPDFLLDTIKCNAVPAQMGTNGTWNLDEGYVPVEFEGFGPNAASSWQISSQANNQGEFGARPPILPAGGSAELKLNCGAEKPDNTLLSFAYYGGPFELFVDGGKYADVPRSGWTTNTLVVPAGKHVYAWKVAAASAGRPDLMLDTLRCGALTATPNTTDTWTFDEGFVPLEFEGFGSAPASSWQITSEALNQGAFGVRPPVLELGASTQLVLNAKAGNPQLQFSYYGGPFEFYIDDQKQDIPRSGWTTRTIATDGAAHTFKWKLTAATSGRPDFLMDTVKRVAGQ